MKLWEAMKALEEGKKVRMKNWDKDGFICMIGSQYYDENCDRVESIKIDLRSEWEIYDEREEVDEFIKNLYKSIWEAYFNRTCYDDYIERHEILDDYVDKLYRQFEEMNKYYKLDK